MPNWCMNRLTISHEDKSKVDEFVAAYKSGTTCDHYLPTPRGADGDIVRDENHPDYWYRHNTSVWGTKWDFGGEDKFIEQTGNNAIASFDTAWSPPEGLYEHLVTLGFDVDATYCEPGVGFAGRWHNGEDDWYEDFSEFPDDLIEEYNLREFLEEDAAT